MRGLATAQCGRSSVRIRVDSVAAGQSGEWVDPRLGAQTAGRLLTHFPYSFYRLLRTSEEETPCGEAIAFNLPAGRILHVCPRTIHGNLIALELVLFEGARALMSTQLTVLNGGLLLLVHSQNPQSADITSIRLGVGNGEPEPGSIGQEPVTAKRQAAQKQTGTR